MDEVRLGGSHLTRVVDSAGDKVDIVDHNIFYEDGGVECYELVVAQVSGDGDGSPDDLTVIPHLGPAAATWLNGYGINLFSVLSTLGDSALANLATDSGAPKGVSAERLSEWRAAAAEEMSK